VLIEGDLPIGEVSEQIVAAVAALLLRTGEPQS